MTNRFVNKGFQIIQTVDSWGIIQHGWWWLLVRINKTKKSPKQGKSANVGKLSAENTIGKIAKMFYRETKQAGENRKYLTNYNTSHAQQSGTGWCACSVNPLLKKTILHWSAAVDPRGAGPAVVQTQKSPAHRKRRRDTARYFSAVAERCAARCFSSVWSR